MRGVSLLLPLALAAGCVPSEPVDAWMMDAEREGELDLNLALQTELSVSLVYEGSLLLDTYVDTGGDAVTVTPGAQRMATGWRLSLGTAEGGHGPMRVLFYSDSDPLVPGVTDIAADASGGSTLGFDSAEVECVFEPETWNTCTRDLRVRVERHDPTPTTLSWRVSAWVLGEDGSASAVDQARLSVDLP